MFAAKSNFPQANHKLAGRYAFKPSSVLATLVLSLLSGACLADSYIKSPEGCLVHNQIPQLNESITWSGACKDGYADGKGIVRWFSNGQVTEIVEAEFVAGKMEGLCRIDNISKGISYDGHCKNDLSEGYGTLTRKNGENYTGLFEKGLPANKGK